MLGAIGRPRCRIMAALACSCAAVPSVQARPSAVPCDASMSFDEPIARAGRRFTISDALIRAVIAVESRGAVSAVSPKGAMGLMQLMPGTWAELRRRHALGSDPFDPCDNILAGTAYLRELLDRYGDPGFLAAYNAGPRRYEAYLAGRSLPRETMVYVARLSGRMGGNVATARALPDTDADAWRRGELFIRATASSANAADPLDAPPSPEPTTKPEPGPSLRLRDSLFAPRTSVSE